MGTLNVYKREGMRRDDLLWTMSGHQGTEWHEALVDIGGACYQVRVYGHEDTVQKPVKSRLGLSWRRFFRRSHNVLGCITFRAFGFDEVSTHQ